jgi:hypothetical protein
MIFNLKTLYLYRSNGFCDVLTGRHQQFPQKKNIDRLRQNPCYMHVCTCVLIEGSQKFSETFSDGFSHYDLCAKYLHEVNTMRKIMGNKPQVLKLGYNYPQSSANTLE